jgi:hypothetical protein
MTMVESTTSTVARLCKFKMVNTFAKIQATKKVKFELIKHNSCVLAWYPPQNTRKPMYITRKIAPSSMLLNSTETNKMDKADVNVDRSNSNPYRYIGLREEAIFV